MRFLLTTAALLFSLPQSADQPYELKGEAPGMTLKQFKSNHKHADCLRRSAAVTNCHVYDGVSFAGVAAQTFRGCATPECAFQGIFAYFIDGRLVRLRYAIAFGSANKVIAALKSKYGEPAVSTATSAKWTNSVGYLSVLDSPGLESRPLDSYTDITSALNDDRQGKDI